ncbi:MAG: hypothetical protein J2P26_12070, partial [Nocardiopsaceae bacterium]|nr:hypothetical protein [Nocardiopsaceae bacterium]
EVLGVPEVGIDDSFFDLGGDSIVSLRLVSMAREAGLQFDRRDVFVHRTVAALAPVAREVAADEAADEIEASEASENEADEKSPADEPAKRPLVELTQDEIDDIERQIS